MAVMLRTIAGLAAILILVGCDKKHSKAIVLEKEHIAVRVATPTPNPTAALAETSASDPTVTTEATPSESGDAEEPAEVERTADIAPDEIEVDGYVMKAKARGTSCDPRAAPDEQWLVKVRTTDNGRSFTVHVAQRQFEKVKEGDRVEVIYRAGKYTGTVWNSELK